MCVSPGKYPEGDFAGHCSIYIYTQLVMAKYHISPTLTGSGMRMSMRVQHLIWAEDTLLYQAPATISMPLEILLFFNF